MAVPAFEEKEVIMLNRTMLFLSDAVGFLGLGAGLWVVVHLGDLSAPTSTNVDSYWPMMHASAAKFIVPGKPATVKE
jgi:hypothetical protein